VDLTATGGFDKRECSLKQRQILDVICRIRTIDLYPLPRTGHAAGLKRNHVIPGEVQFGCRGRGQTQADAVATDAGKHFVADEVGVEAVYFSGTGAWEFKEQGVELCLAAGGRGIGIQLVIVIQK
jgi:hypothetical protein